MTSKVTFHPLTPDRWDDLVDLFGPERGACAGCWCMWPRIRQVEFRSLTKLERRNCFRQLVHNGPPPGLLAYAGSLPIGWVAISPRRAVRRFNIAKNSAPLTDDESALDTAWAITCFFVRNSHRGQSLTTRLADAAVTYAQNHKALSVEVCAIEPDKRLTWGEAFVGVASALRSLGFVEVARRSPKRPLLRLELPPDMRFSRGKR
jgi:GNAT superfamily N-acetyltransferase